jgi:hypothetical protein
LVVELGLDGGAPAGGRINVEERAFGYGFQDRVALDIAQCDFHSGDAVHFSVDLENELDRILGRDLDHCLALRFIHSTTQISAASLLARLGRLDFIRVQRQCAQRKQQSRHNVVDLLHLLARLQLAVCPRIAQARIANPASKNQ